MILRLHPSRLCGSVTVPPSKSLLHRELICRRLAGQTTPLPPRPADDIRYTAAALRLLDAPSPTVCCGDSGSTLRFLLPLFMALGRTDAVFTGSSRLLQRPIPAELGLRAAPAGLALTQPLRSGIWTLSAAATSQVVSGLLMALPLLPGSSDIMLTDKPVSRPYLDMTCHVLRHHGVTVTGTDGGWHIDGGQTYRPAPLLTAPDWSAAAFCWCSPTCNSSGIPPQRGICSVWNSRILKNRKLIGKKSEINLKFLKFMEINCCGICMAIRSSCRIWTTCRRALT